MKQTALHLQARLRLDAAGEHLKQHDALVGCWHLMTAKEGDDLWEHAGWCLRCVNNFHNEIDLRCRECMTAHHKDHDRAVAAGFEDQGWCPRCQDKPATEQRHGILTLNRAVKAAPSRVRVRVGDMWSECFMESGSVIRLDGVLSLCHVCNGSRDDAMMPDAVVVVVMYPGLDGATFRSANRMELDRMADEKS